MEITWYGQSFFVIKVKRGKRVLRFAIDPFDKKIGLKVPKVKADLLLITHSHHDHSNEGALRGKPFLIEGPGEYEVKKILVKGIRSFHDESEGKERGLNTIYKVKAEGINLCHLGDLGQKELNPEQLEAIGEVDILLIPVGGTYTVNAKRAAAVVSQIEPKIVIPMHYKLPKLKLDIENEKKFLKTMGAEDVKPRDTFEIKKKGLPKEEETEIVVLKPQN